VSLYLQLVRNSEEGLREAMRVHYSQPKGFVGRNICYAVYWDSVRYGFTVGGSTPKWLKRLDSMKLLPLNSIVNNIFFHVAPVGGRYPVRNFVPMVISEWRKQIAGDWQKKYGDVVDGFETLVELPRLGTCYLRDGWVEVGITKGQTCKRIAGQGTDSWSGKRVWDTKNLRPKRVFAFPLRARDGHTK
jgi:hypothetical protein